jgi:alpha-L-arabinofuranosidase
MIGLERNGDVVTMASYAPLLAKVNHTQWKTDLIFFDNKAICLTPNYHVQKMFSVNHGDRYVNNVIFKDGTDSTLAASCVQDSKTGDIILKLVNAGDEPKVMSVDLSAFRKINSAAALTMLTGKPDAENTLEDPNAVIPVSTTLKMGKVFQRSTPPMSLSIIRIKTR